MDLLEAGNSKSSISECVSKTDSKKCTRCGQIKSKNDFYKEKRNRDGCSSYCISCHKEHGKEYFEKNKSQVLARCKAYKASHVKERRAEYQRTKEKYSERAHIRNAAMRDLVVDHYGGRCACCGEATREFLEIDHINGGGNKHRREIKCFGNKFYDWLIKNDFPEGFQVLCSNCNMSKGRYGYCPHGGLK
jgi:coproporphyrinogen III oxidase